MEALLESILKSAMDRRPERLSFETTYSHMNIKEWLRSIFPNAATLNIIVPETEKTIPITEKTCSSSSSSKELNNLALPVQPESEIPCDNEPLSYFLSKFIAKDLGVSKFDGGNNYGKGYDVQYLLRLYRVAKTYMDKFPPGLTCRCLLKLNEYLWQEVKSPNFWEHVKDSHLENPSFKDFLFGHGLAKINIMKVIESRAGQRQPICIPLYVLCYLFDENELTNDELQRTSVETAQYSLHVVGLVVYWGVVMVADPNGVLRGGSNMEFLSMPLTKLDTPPTTCVSRYDRDVQIQANEQIQEKANEASQSKVKKAQAQAKLLRIKGEGKKSVECQNAKTKKARIDEV